VRDARDFERMSYEALERVAVAGGRYAEVFFSPHAHAHARYGVMLDGIISGMHAAAVDFDLFSQLIPAHNRELGPDAGVEFVEMVGYHVVDDAELVAACREAGTFFTCCPTTTLYTTQWRDPAAPDHAIRQMLEAGLAITINSDDPGLMQTTLAEEYAMVAERMGATPEQLKAICLNGIRASWLDDVTKSEMLAAWSLEIDAVYQAQGETV